LLLYLNKRTTSIEPKEVYGPLSEQMGLSAEKLRIKLVDGRPAWPNLVQWARNGLVKDGFMHRLPKSQWSLTDAGRLRAAKLETGCDVADAVGEDFWGPID
jgi:hypothetical protein